MVAFLASQSRRLDRAQPDGNCLFRSLSKQLFNSEKQHITLREMLNKHVTSHPEVYKYWTIEGLSLTQHLQQMNVPGTWGSQPEIAATATLFQKTIYVALDSLLPNKCRWTAFSPLCIPDPSTCSSILPQPTNRTWLEIAHSNRCHYDAVYCTLTEVSSKSSILTGQTIFVPDVL